MRFEERYRPRTFEEVMGQPFAVRLLSNLTMLGAPRSLLLQGSSGCGKTTFARMYSAAMNCTNLNRATGSPCLQCTACLKPREYFHEINAAAGHDLAHLKDLVTALDRTPTDHTYTVIFFDEAHQLSSPVQHFLRKAVENRDPRVIYILATTDASKLDPQLRSRLLDVAIHPLSTDVSIELLERIAKHEGLSYDVSALHLLTAVKPPQPRDLTIALQQLGAFGQHIDEALVRCVFDVSSRDYLKDFALALGTGCSEKQSACLAKWSATIEQKFSLIELFLFGAFANNVCGQWFSSTQIIDSLADARLDVVQTICRRAGLKSARQAIPIFDNMLEIVCRSNSDSSDLLHLRLCRLMSFMNDETQWPCLRPASVPGVERRPVSGGKAMASPDWESFSSSNGGNYLDRAEVREIINRSSFMVQEYGIHFNACFLINTVVHQRARETAAFAAVRSFCVYLQQQCSDPLFASIALLERHDAELVGRVAVHIPRAVRNSPAEIHRWCEEWSEKEGHVIEEVSLSSEADQVFHVEALKTICAGFQPLTGGDDDLRGLLGIRRTVWRPTGPFAAPRLLFSPNLSTANVEACCENGMLPLSAFDPGAFGQVFSGWEALEHPERKAEQALREGIMRELEASWCHDPARLELEKSISVGRWNRECPDERPRRWNKRW